MMFRRLLLPALAVAVIALAGCSRKEFDGPTVDAFNGKLLHNGKPIALAGQETKLELFLIGKKPESFLIPIREDGSFKIGWMPIGKYNATLIRKKAGVKGGPLRYQIPEGLTIEDGKTEYSVELGNKFKL